MPWGTGRESQGPASPFGFGGSEHKSVTPMSMGPGPEWGPQPGGPASPGYVVPVAEPQEVGAPVGPHYTGTTARTVSQITSSPPPEGPLAELPTSPDPGNSPHPTYRQFS